MPEHHREHRDYFGNLTATVVIREPHTQLRRRQLLRDRHRRTSDRVRRPRPTAVAFATRPREAGPHDLLVVEFSLDSARVRTIAELAEYAQSVVRRRHAPRRRRVGALQPHPRRLRVRRRRHQGRHPARDRAGDAPGCLPGLRPRDDRCAAIARARGVLRERLPGDRAPAGQAAARPASTGRTPGSACTSAVDAGSASTRRTIRLPVLGTSPRREAVTIPTCHPCGV